MCICIENTNCIYLHNYNISVKIDIKPKKNSNTYRKHSNTQPISTNWSTIMALFQIIDFMKSFYYWTMPISNIFRNAFGF